MDEDVVDHGPFTEFLSHLRCEGCQKGNHKCIVQESDQQCLVCTGAHGPCIFTRTVAVKGPKAAFQWAQLRSNDALNTVTIDQYQNASMYAESSALQPSHIRGEDLEIRTRTQSLSPARQDHVRKSRKSETHQSEPICRELKGSDSLWRKAIKYSQVLAAFQSAGKAFQDAGKRHHDKQLLLSRQPEKIFDSTHFDPYPPPRLPMQLDWTQRRKALNSNYEVLNTSMEPVRHRRTRRLSSSGRAHAKEIRRRGACKDCRRKKCKCDHNPIDHSVPIRPPGFTIEDTTSLRSIKELSPSQQVLRRRYPCTFCGNQFRRMSDWRRHESQHAPQTEYVCMATDPLITVDNRRFCMFCRLEDPDEEHFLNNHNISSCLGKNRNFTRKDHLTEHIRRFHDANNLNDWKIIDSWIPIKAPEETTSMWLCNYCSKSDMTWLERSDHVLGHLEEMNAKDEAIGAVTWPTYPVTRPVRLPEEIESTPEEASKPEATQGLETFSFSGNTDVEYPTWVHNTRLYARNIHHY